VTRIVGRLRPYTVKELAAKRVLCAGCGKPAVHQWSCCSNKYRHVAVCLDCDFALNEMTLAFFRIPGRVELLTKYRRKELRSRS
jgi:hypothetical protein